MTTPAKILKIHQSEPDQNLIGLLEELLDDVKAGKAEEVLIVSSLKSNPSKLFTFSSNSDPRFLLYAAESIRAQIEWE